MIIFILMDNYGVLFVSKFSREGIYTGGGHLSTQGVGIY